MGGQVTTDAGDGDLEYSQLTINNRNALGHDGERRADARQHRHGSGAVYDGGVEDVLRFIERRSGDTLLYRGSIVDLWNSLVATGAWSYGNPIYRAPVRDWGFDIDFLDPTNFPPARRTCIAFV